MLAGEARRPFVERHFAWIAGVLFGAALVVRLIPFSDGFIDFHPTRQYHGALIARGMYLDSIGARDSAKNIAARRAQNRRGVLEPQIIERLAATGYELAGKEHPAIPRGLSILFWMLGGVALLGTARRLTTPLGALVAAAAFLFQPYGIVASESMQPDLLMMMLACVSLYAIVRYDEAPTFRRALFVGVAAGLAGLVKPVCLPIIGGLHLALRLRNSKLTTLLRDPREWTLAACVATPVGGHYVRNILAGKRLKNLSGMTFRPHLLVTKKFWLAWARKLAYVLGGYWVILIVPIGIWCARGRLRWALAGLSGGYFVTGLVFNFHFSTHDHYQLTIFPAFVLALAAITEAVVKFVTPRAVGYRAAALGVAALAVVWTGHRIVTESYPLLRGDSSRIADYRKIGRAVKNSQNVMFATDDGYGSPLEYYGWLSGWYFEMRKVSWGLVEAPKDNLAELKQHLMDFEPEYFVIIPPSILRQQPESRDHLEQVAYRRRRTKNYVIYDLKPPPEGETDGEVRRPSRDTPKRKRRPTDDEAAEREARPTDD